ncbi:MAG: ShlB/FhaC/HecB family hemolysin secretion/activation protein [Methylophilus sp.]|nr:ShlB/FhaC/HecB family hemolysin secretion/activation protein [Methylophilus sp.]
MCFINRYKRHQVVFIVIQLLFLAVSFSHEAIGAVSDSEGSAVTQEKSTTETETLRTKESPPSAEKVEAKEEARTFDIYEFQVIGNTKLSKMQIETAVYHQMGENKTIQDVEKARDGLEKAYHEAGYLTVLVDIPEQEVDNKVVKLNVTEAKVNKFRISGSHYYSLGRIKALSPSVQEGEVPHFPTVQKDIARLNRTSDKRVTPVLKAGRVFGTVDVDLKVEDSLPLHASLELNDKYSRDTTRLRLGGMIKYDNLWQRDHSFSLNFLTAPENFDEVKVLSGNYLMRFDDSDVLLALYGVWSESSVATAGGINILGDGKIAGLRLIKPLPALESYFHSLSLGVDYKDFGQRIVFNNSTPESPVTYMPISALYSGTYQEKDATTQFNLGVVMGIRGLFTDDKEFDEKQPGAKPDFFVSKLEVSRTQTLPNQFEGFVKLDGQFAVDKLISNEQYLAGGADSVRGYLESEVAADRGLHATFELRSPPFLKQISWIKDLKLATFYDAAHLITIDPAEGQEKTSNISGVGFGAYLKTNKNIFATLEFAWPLEDSDATQAGDFRSHMRLWYEF